MEKLYKWRKFILLFAIHPVIIFEWLLHLWAKLRPDMLPSKGFGHSLEFSVRWPSSKLQIQSTTFLGKTWFMHHQCPSLKCLLINDRCRVWNHKFIHVTSLEGKNAWQSSKKRQVQIVRLACAGNISSYFWSGYFNTGDQNKGWCCLRDLLEFSGRLHPPSGSNHSPVFNALYHVPHLMMNLLESPSRCPY